MDNSPTFSILYRKLKHRAGILFLLFMVVLPVVAWLALRLCMIITTSHGNALLLEFKQLRPHESTFEDVMRVVRHYPGLASVQDSPCSASYCEVRVGTGRGWAGMVPVVHALDLERAGIRASWFTASVQVLDNRVVRKKFEVWTEATWGTPHGLWLIARSELTDYFDEADVHQWQRAGLQGHPGFYVTEPHLSTAGGGRMLIAKVAENATDGEIERAFDFRLSCTSALKGCSELRDLLPGAWENYVAFGQQSPASKY